MHFIPAFWVQSLFGRKGDRGNIPRISDEDLVAVPPRCAGVSEGLAYQVESDPVILNDKVLTHYGQSFHGLQWRAELGAMGAPQNVDAKALCWTLDTLDEDKNAEDFAARMPGFFDSHKPDTTSTIISLVSDQPTSEPILGSRLCDLLSACLPETSLLIKKQRKSRLRVWLTNLSQSSRMHKCQLYSRNYYSTYQSNCPRPRTWKSRKWRIPAVSWIRRQLHLLASSQNLRVRSVRDFGDSSTPIRD